MKQLFKVLLIPPFLLLLGSCSAGKLEVSSVGYRSVRTSFAQSKEIPSDAKIATEYFINADGALLAVVYNLTNEIMTIDQTKSFFINTDGSSASYYDPTVRTSTSGGFSSNTNSTTFNLGAIAGVFGVGGPLGTVLNSTSVGTSATSGLHSSNTVTITDQPTVSIGPKGKMAMSKQYTVAGIEEAYLGKYADIGTFQNVTMEQSPLKFSVCISYTIGNNPEPQKLITDFYVNAKIIQPVSKNKVGDAFRSIYDIKPDALVEPSFLFIVNTNLPPEKKVVEAWGEEGTAIIHTKYAQGSLIDYQ